MTRLFVRPRDPRLTSGGFAVFAPGGFLIALAAVRPPAPTRRD